MNKELKIYISITILMGAMLLPSLVGFISYVSKSGFHLFINWSFATDALYMLAGLTGITVFASTKFKRSALLRMYMCYIIFMAPVSLIAMMIIINRSIDLQESFAGSRSFYLRLLYTVITTACSFAGLWLLSRKQEPALNYITIANETIGEFQTAPAIQRLVNRLVDVIIIAVVLYKDVARNYIFRESFRNTGYGTLILLETLITAWYYIILEGVFNTSMGKCITDTIVVNINGRKPGLVRIIGRTLCRFIPFDALSFFANRGRGWHDSLSDTWVVRAVDHSKE